MPAAHGRGPKIDDKSTEVLPYDRALQLFLAGGNLRGSSSKADFAKLANLDRRYKAAAKAAVVRAKQADDGAYRFSPNSKQPS